MLATNAASTDIVRDDAARFRTCAKGNRQDRLGRAFQLHLYFVLIPGVDTVARNRTTALFPTPFPISAQLFGAPQYEQDFL